MAGIKDLSSFGIGDRDFNFDLKVLASSASVMKKSFQMFSYVVSVAI